MVLHSAAFWLSLPAIKVSAVVGADTFPSHLAEREG
jgi:hypothetical protein